MTDNDKIIITDPVVIADAEIVAGLFANKCIKFYINDGILKYANNKGLEQQINQLKLIKKEKGDNALYLGIKSNLTKDKAIEDAPAEAEIIEAIENLIADATEIYEDKTALAEHLQYVKAETVLNDIKNYNNSYEIENSIYYNKALAENNEIVITTDAIYYNIENDYYFKLFRSYNSYELLIGTYDKQANKFKPVTTPITSKEPINKLSKQNETLIKNYDKTVTAITTGIYAKYEQLALSITSTSEDYTVLNAPFNEFNKAKQFNTDMSADYNPVLDEINNREHPKYDKSKAEIFENNIKQYGLIPYLEQDITKIHLGSNKGIYKKLLASFNIMNGTGSYLFNTTSASATGKSEEDKTIFMKMLPAEYVLNKNNITEASFIRYAKVDPKYFNRTIIYLGDLGNVKAQEKIEPVLDIIKQLITENEYTKDLAEQVGNNKEFIPVSISLKTESIGGAYTTIYNDNTKGDNEQLSSRTINCTAPPVKYENLTVHMAKLEAINSRYRIAYDYAVNNLEYLQEYLKYKVNEDLTVVNPYYKVFADYSKPKGQTAIRHYKQHMELFNSYCILTSYNCKEYKGHLIASKQQLEEYFMFIAEEDAIMPLQSEFIKMLKATGKSTELKMLKEPTAEDKIADYNVYLNEMVEEVGHKLVLKRNVKLFEYDIDETTLDEYNTAIEPNYMEDLNKQEQDLVINKLLQKYKLAGRSTEHKENVFFTVNDITQTYKKYRPFKNVSNISEMLNQLYQLDYIGKLEYKNPRNNQNIYYLTDKCAEIGEPITITEANERDAQDYLNDLFN